MQSKSKQSAITFKQITNLFLQILEIKQILHKCEKTIYTSFCKFEHESKQLINNQNMFQKLIFDQLIRTSKNATAQTHYKFEFSYNYQ